MYRNGYADHGASRDKGPHRGLVRYRFCCNLRQDKCAFQENPKPNSRFETVGRVKMEDNGRKYAAQTLFLTRLSYCFLVDR